MLAFHSLLPDWRASARRIFGGCTSFTDQAEYCQRSITFLALDYCYIYKCSFPTTLAGPKFHYVSTLSTTAFVRPFEARFGINPLLRRRPGHAASYDITAGKLYIPSNMKKPPLFHLRMKKLASRRTWSCPVGQRTNMFLGSTEIITFSDTNIYIFSMKHSSYLKYLRSICELKSFWAMATIISLSAVSEAEFGCGMYSPWIWLFKTSSSEIIFPRASRNCSSEKWSRQKEISRLLSYSQTRLC